MVYLCKNITHENNLNISDIQNIDFIKEKYKTNKHMKEIVQENYKKLFFKKLNSLTENNKLFIYSKFKKKYETEPYLL